MQQTSWETYMRQGDVENAWRMSDARLGTAGSTGGADPATPRHQQEIWDGRPLDGARVLVRCYHGLGDTIQFARYLPHVARIAASVTVWARPNLIPLLRTIDARCDYLPLHDGAPEVDYDVDVEIMELPWVFRTTLDSIPAQVPYFKVAAGARPHRSRPRVGLVWRAGDWDERRSIDGVAWTELLEIGSVEWVSCQHRPRPHEWPLPDGRVDADDLHEYATGLAGLDLLITVDSMPAHLAGAIALPVWVLLPRDHDWRWMDRADSPWYPTMRLFRQHDAGNWMPVIDEVQSQLPRLCC